MEFCYCYQINFFMKKKISQGTMRVARPGPLLFLLVQNLNFICYQQTTPASKRLILLYISAASRVLSFSLSPNGQKFAYKSTSSNMKTRIG